MWSCQRVPGQSSDAGSWFGRPAKAMKSGKQVSPRVRLGHFFGLDQSSRFVFVEKSTRKVHRSSDCTVRWSDQGLEELNYTPRVSEQALDTVDWMALRLTRQSCVDDVDPFAKTIYAS